MAAMVPPGQQQAPVAMPATVAPVAAAVAAAVAQG
jgi:hypothetical protein